MERFFFSNRRAPEWSVVCCVGYCVLICVQYISLVFGDMIFLTVIVLLFSLFSKSGSVFNTSTNFLFGQSIIVHVSMHFVLHVLCKE